MTSKAQQKAQKKENELQINKQLKYSTCQTGTK